tara:strand:+ start:19309 stop:19881 length:573 start_codon:yes stop_codon:yes gene_type:complete
MENVNFVNMHRYQAIERVVYQKVKEWKPKVIVELGHGSGALTSAMGLALKEINNGGMIHSYDINGITNYNLGSMSESALKNIEKRNLTSIVKFTKGNIFDTWVNHPFHFDLLVVDVDNTWNIIYNILIGNNFINNKIKKGSKILIEGGDPNHPRINQETLNFFNNNYGEELFTLKYLDGSGRTSISILEI